MAGLDMMPLECVDKVEPSNILPQTVGASGHTAFLPLAMTTMVNFDIDGVASSLQPQFVIGITDADVRCVEQGVWIPWLHCLYQIQQLMSCGDCAVTSWQHEALVVGCGVGVMQQSLLFQFLSVEYGCRGACHYRDTFWRWQVGEPVLLFSCLGLGSDIIWFISLPSVFVLVVMAAVIFTEQWGCGTSTGVMCAAASASASWNRKQSKPPNLPDHL